MQITSRYPRINALDFRIHNISNNQHYAYFWSTEVALFHQGNKKFSTTGGGIDVTGNTVADGLVIDGNSDLNGDLDVDGHTNLDNVSIAGVTTTTDNIDIDADNKKLQIGASQDLQLFHDGGHSRITNTTGILKLTAPAGQSVRVVPPDDSGNVAVFHIDGSTHLYYDSAHKFSTVSDGIDVVGNILMNDSKLTHRGDTDTKIRFPANDTFTVETAGNERLRIDSSGRVMIGTTTEGNGNADEFTISYINHAGVSGGDQGRCGMTIRSGDNTSGVTQNGYIYFSDGTSGGNESKGVVAYEHSNDAMYFSTDQVARLRIDSSGRVLIGTSTEGHENANTLTLSNSGTAGMTIRSTSSNCHIYFSDATSGAGEYVGQLGYNHGSDYMFFHTGGSERFRANSSGITVTGTVDSASDVVLKENIKTIDNALDKVTKLRGVEYDYKDNKKHSIGVMFQRLKKYCQSWSMDQNKNQLHMEISLLF